MLSGRCVLVAVSGGIACYKACEVVSSLRKSGADVRVIMTEHATEFVSPLTFETLSNNPVVVDMFRRNTPWEVEHVSLAKRADLAIVVPATANVIDKLACGIADDMLTTTLLATKAKILVCPAMNVNMYENPALQDNMALLRKRGFAFVNSDEGFLACGDVGKGRLAPPEKIVAAAIDLLMPVRDYAGKKVLVTAGATREDVDGIRFISNYSSGKMGIEIAKAVKDRGGSVVLVAGFVTERIPDFIDKVVRTESTADMLDAVLAEYKDCDVIIKAAAPADYRPAEPLKDKAKSASLTLELVKNPDIAKAVGSVKEGRRLVVFCAEKKDLEKRAREKLASKHADMVVANDVTREGAGFGKDTNVATIITASGKVRECPLMSKRELADIILDEVNCL